MNIRTLNTVALELDLILLCKKSFCVKSFVRRQDAIFILRIQRKAVPRKRELVKHTKRVIRLF